MLYLLVMRVLRPVAVGRVSDGKGEGYVNAKTYFDY